MSKPCSFTCFQVALLCCSARLIKISLLTAEPTPGMHKRNIRSPNYHWCPACTLTIAWGLTLLADMKSANSFNHCTVVTSRLCSASVQNGKGSV